MPTAPFTALERRRSEFLFQTAVVLSAAEGPASFWYHSSHVLDHGEAWEQEAMYMLVNAAAEPLMRRVVHVRGELRFTFARLTSLFDAGEPARPPMWWQMRSVPHASGSSIRVGQSAIADRAALNEVHRQGSCGRGHVPTPGPQQCR